MSYRRYSDYLKEKYGTKAYKLPINLPLTCPNRDGTLGEGGCIYCGNEGAGFETLSGSFTVAEQIEIGKQKMAELYKARAFIAYFQSFSNTYMPVEAFGQLMDEAARQGVAEIAVATRPDCVSGGHLDALKAVCERYGICATIELGLQTVNYRTLEIINRGHTLAEFIDAVLRIKTYGFEICTHVILNLPWDDIKDSIETAKIVSALDIDHVKLHALYVLKCTPLAEMYLNGQFKIIPVEEYMERAITFLEYLRPETSVQRIIGRAPEDACVFANWATSWWKIHDDIQAVMRRDNRFQGKRFDYLNGSALKGNKRSVNSNDADNPV